MDQNRSEKPCPDEIFYGSVTVGERGQVVIPAKARRDLGIENGDQLLIMGHPSKNGIMMLKVEAIREFLNQMTENLKQIENQNALLASHAEGEG